MGALERGRRGRKTGHSMIRAAAGHAGNQRIVGSCGKSACTAKREMGVWKLLAILENQLICTQVADEAIGYRTMISGDRRIDAI